MSKLKNALEKPVKDAVQPDMTKEPEKKSKKEKKKDKIDLHRPLCKLVHDDILDDHFSEYQALVNPPAYICKKCGRAAADKKSLCKPVRIE
jgi:hypothetical protein